MNAANSIEEYAEMIEKTALKEKDTKTVQNGQVLAADRFWPLRASKFQSKFENPPKTPIDSTPPNRYQPTTSNQSNHHTIHNP